MLSRMDRKDMQKYCVNTLREFCIKKSCDGCVFNHDDSTVNEVTEILEKKFRDSGGWK